MITAIHLFRRLLFFFIPLNMQPSLFSVGIILNLLFLCHVRSFPSQSNPEESSKLIETSMSDDSIYLYFSNRQCRSVSRWYLGTNIQWRMISWKNISQIIFLRFRKVWLFDAHMEPHGHEVKCLMNSLAISVSTLPSQRIDWWNLSSGANNTLFIERMMRDMENLTSVNGVQCIRFRPKNGTDTTFITIFNGSGCFAPVGSWGNHVAVRGVSLMHSPTSTCMISGTIQHELNHVLGNISVLNS